jgi:hypothetical protein
MMGDQSLGKRVAKLITCMCLLAFLLGVGCTGCGIGRPPVMTLEQWQAADDSVRSSSGDRGHEEASVMCPTWRRGATLVGHPVVLSAIGSSGRYKPALVTAC